MGHMTHLTLNYLRHWWYINLPDGSIHSFATLTDQFWAEKS